MILVTGASGKTGRAVLAALQARSAVTRSLVRKHAELPGEVMLGDMSDLATAERALQGIEALYFIAPNIHPHEREIGAMWITAAKAAGLRRFVYHSVLFPQIEAMPHHWQKLRVEEELIQSGLDFTILQPASYMQNLLPYLAAMRERGEYLVPYSGETPFSPVDLGDVAEAAASVLLGPGHNAATYQLAGPETLSSAQMAELVAQHIGRPVAARQLALAEWQAANQGLPPYARDTLSAMFAFYEAHGFAASSAPLAGLLGRQPASFKTFLEGEIK